MIKEGHEVGMEYTLFNMNVLNIYKSKDLDLLLLSLKNESLPSPSPTPPDKQNCVGRYEGEGPKDI